MVIFLYTCNLHMFVWIHHGCTTNMVFILDPSNRVIVSRYPSMFVGQIQENSQYTIKHINKLSEINLDDCYIQYRVLKKNHKVSLSQLEFYSPVNTVLVRLSQSVSLLALFLDQFSPSSKQLTSTCLQTFDSN